MKEPIQQAENIVSIVIYDAPLPPRYLKFSKKFIRTLFIVLPLILGITFLSLIILALGSKFREMPAHGLSKVMDEETKIAELEAEIKSLNESNKTLQNKLSSPSLNAGEVKEEPYLVGVKKPYGMQNLMSENRVSLDQFELIQNQNKVSFKFAIISTKPETKVTGHVLVFMMNEHGLTAYPSEVNSALPGGVKYSMGEPFSVSRLRPTNAEFSHSLGGNSVRFLIYIFTREGDLILIKETESYSLGEKK